MDYLRFRAPNDWYMLKMTLGMDIGNIDELKKAGVLSERKILLSELRREVTTARIHVPRNLMSIVRGASDAAFKITYTSDGFLFRSRVVSMERGDSSASTAKYVPLSRKPL